MNNGHQTTTQPETILVLSDRISVALLSVTWIMLLAGLVWMWRRNRRLARQLMKTN